MNELADATNGLLRTVLDGGYVWYAGVALLLIEISTSALRRLLRHE